MVGRLVLPLLRLLDDREGVNILPDFKLSVRVLQLLYFAVELVQVLQQLRLVRWVLLEGVQARL